MKDETQATIIKVAAVVTAMPRWIQALLAAEGLTIATSTPWLIFSAVMSGAMAIVEGFAFAFVFSAWRNQTDNKSDNLIWMAVASAVAFVGVIAPYIGAVVGGQTMAEFLPGWILRLLWGVAVAASTILIVVSVGYAQKATSRKDTNPELEKARAEAREAKHALTVAETRAKEAELKLEGAGEIVKLFTMDQKRDRILAAKARWPELPASSIAYITQTSVSYVSEILKEAEAER